MCGEPVAMVVAETAAAAQDAAERVVVDYEVLPAVTDAIAALAPGAPLIHESVSGNLAVEAEFGDHAAAQAAFAAADLVVTQTFRNQRIASAQMEPRAALAAYDPAQGLYTIHTCSQGAVRIKGAIAACLGVPPECVRVITGDVGGAFGLLSNAYCEQVMVAFAARHVGRPVKWTNSRSEAFLTDYQGRDIATEGRLALAADGRILALAVAMTGNIGAHAVTYVPLSNAYRVTPTVYDIPAAAVTIRGALTNTVPTAPFRGAGRPEATLRPRAPHRHRGATARHRPRRAAAAQPDPARAASLSLRHRPRLRQREFPRQHGRGAQARGLAGLSGTPPRGRRSAGCSPASASPTTSNPRSASPTSMSRSACAPTASRPWPAPSRAARATRRPSPRCSPTGSASRRRT